MFKDIGYRINARKTRFATRDSDSRIFRDLEVLTERHRGGKSDIMEGAELNYLLRRIHDAREHKRKLLPGNGSGRREEIRSVEEEINHCLEIIIAAHWKYAITVANNTLANVGADDISEDDRASIHQVVLLTITKATLRAARLNRTFADDRIGSAFRSFCSRWVAGQVLDELTRVNFVIQPPHHTFRMARIYPAVVEYMWAYGNTINEEEIARISNRFKIDANELKTEVIRCGTIEIAEKKLSDKLNLIAEPVRLDAKDKNGHSIVGRMPGKSRLPTDVRVARALESAAKSLTPNRRIVFASYAESVLSEWDEPTQVRVAEELGMTRANVSSLLKQCYLVLSRNPELRRIAAEFGVISSPIREGKRKADSQPQAARPG